MASTLGPLFKSLTEGSHTFIQPSLPLYTDTLTYLRHALDPLAADVSSIQQQRQREARKKRKRGDRGDEEDVLRLKQIHTEGFGPEQVWEQARRVIEAAKAEAERGFAEAQRGEAQIEDTESLGEELEDGPGSDDESLGVEGVDYEVEGLDDGDEQAEEDEDDLQGALDEAEAGVEDDYEDDDIEMDEEGASDEDENEQPAEELVEDKFGLNDGFFSIDNFNKQSEFLEQQDARAENDGAESDEEDVDWDANPLAQPLTAGEEDEVDAEEDYEDDEDGPTFGDPDAASEDEDEEVGAGDLDVAGGMGNTNNVLYADFFAPPASKKRKNKKGRPNPHNFPAPATNGAPEGQDEDGMERTMAAVHRDLFEDEESGEEDENENAEQYDPGDPKQRRSNHERRKAALQEEIRKLEAANVAKRDWQLQGEARAADRPTNALLEEDLEFERAGKPVPVITAEVSESIEELIKRRILAHDFQDILRRRPDDLGTGSKRGRLDLQLDDTKSKKGLAEEYEEEHLRRTDPNFVDAKDEKTKKEEKEIEALWNKVRTDLDSLSSWHFRPKQPAPTMDIRVDAPVVSMEDARPNAGGEVAGASQLAPQEVYKGGEGIKGVNEEVAGKSGLPTAREELSREEKKRRRRREKERIRKASGSQLVDKTESKGKQRKEEMLGDLKKGNVKVIGSKGKVTDVEGKEARSGGGQQGAGQYKL
ncbi:hypothetical protein B0A50_05683 [Salinomyces thailandicus]|uniref:U3 small nucleolar ribonucleoprotein protein MPP10 n=1 Tax=Salinomyces thailandicus TaxID=706561 RepID=A0A4U0TSD1_9PEZI|nr:hypothetical protein B0A50_05683 [Salinomyces thailandica]